ncbi:MAG: peptidase T4 [Stappia sp.]|uniref:P1 family peptidase n=1 Tax=Stappia sp. TaxID=1870903 RepID=UPI000C61E431|nr:P1 family peptidase [Stappia sp.]MAB00387.1 peptidase T4 [Stappia sp.]MBM19802.1 peptidase T4 [Stappia sp.]
MRNLITDVPGLKVGNAQDDRLKSGVTVLVPDEAATASVSILGGAPGTRDTTLLEPEYTAGQIDALVLSGGSAFGLDAASGVQAGLAAMGRGFAIGPARVPLVPAAILFDLLNGGDKDWGETNPYAALGREALASAGETFALGTSGAGTGATTATFKGGLGSASARLSNGAVIGALVAVNALGSATMGDTPHFWAAPFERDGEFGGLGLPSEAPGADAIHTKFNAARPGANTTIGIVATDLALDKAALKRLAIMTHDGYARALWPSHTALDGDLVFALSTGRVPLREEMAETIEAGALAAAVMSRAIARAVHAATPAPGDTLPAWSQHFGGRP